MKRNEKTSICIKSILSITLLYFCLSPAQANAISTSYQNADTLKTFPSIISVNQSGYNVGSPKRFTVPKSAEGQPFTVTKENNNTPLFKGKLHKGIGDFTAFNPVDNKGQFVVRVNKLVSYPFSIGKHWIENTFLQSSLDFMIDDRSVVGTHPSAFGGCPWRDGTYYSFEVPSLIMQYMANPTAYEALPVQIDYQKDKQKVTAPGFKYVMDSEGQSALKTTQRYYTELDAPVGPNVPDIIQLIHWGIGFYILNPITLDPSGDFEGRRLHAQTVEQFAFFLYAYPMYKKYFTDAYYAKAKELAFKSWSDAGLFELFTTVGTGKGRECPGHSIMPNLLMFEVAKREGNKDSSKFLNAAIQQTEWIVKNLDWNDPHTTKGQRMSEHKLIPSLVYFLQHYPKQAPKGLKQKISDWADVTIKRSNNIWDFRRYDLDNNWTIPEYSESGNIAGFPASALAAAAVQADPLKVKRLEQLAYAAIDDLFGRNPLNACSPHHHTLGFQNLEKGWPKAYRDDVCARLETVRGGISSACSTEMYPYNPNGKFRHPEGWTAFNAAWNVSLAYLTFYNSGLKFMGK